MRARRAPKGRETRSDRVARARRLFDALDAQMPEAHIVLRFQNELELLVCVLLAAQCTDQRVNEVTPALFERFRTPADYAKAGAAGIEPYIARLGLYRTKARHLAAMGRAIVEQHEGRVPRTREALAQLPGVGWKTAGVVVSEAFGVPAFAVDTHVGRLARRMGLSSKADPRKVEEELAALWPPGSGSAAN